MAKKDALAQFHREAISSAADSLFQEKGLEKTTMDDIARAADYSKATLYVYFKSKEEIHYYIILKAMRLLLLKTETAIKSTSDAIGQYRAVCTALAEYSRQNPFYYKSLLETIAADPESRIQTPILEEIFQTGEQINGCVLAMIERGIEQGVFRKDTPALPTGLLYWGMISSAIQLAANKADYLQMRMDMSTDDFLELAFGTMLRAILTEEANKNEKED